MSNEVDETGAGAPVRLAAQPAATAAPGLELAADTGAAHADQATAAPSQYPDAQGGASGVAARLAAWLRAHAPEILLYYAARLLALIVLGLMAAHAGDDALGLLGKWDGVWYLGIARHGYDTALTYRPGGTLVNTNIAFFPLYPLLIRVLGPVVGPLHAALLISWVAGGAAAVGIRAVGERLYGKRAGVIAAVLWGVLPTAIVESMAYTESLFTAFVAFTLLALTRRRWVTAGVLAVFAGLTHPYGLALAAAVGLCALVEIVRAGRGQQSWRPWAGGALAPLGALAFLAYAAVGTGRWDGWFLMEREGWNNRPSLGGTLREVELILTRGQLLGYYVTLAVVLVALICAAALSWHRAPLPLQLFTWIAVAMALASGPGYFFAKGRFLLPVFPLLLPIARHLARSRLRTVAVALGAAALASAWYGGYLLLIWPHSP